MVYKTTEENRLYHRIYYEEQKNRNPEAYEKRKEQARQYYYKKKGIENNLDNKLEKREYIKRNLKKDQPNIIESLKIESLKVTEEEPEVIEVKLEEPEVIKVIEEEPEIESIEKIMVEGCGVQ
jgi:hypothetical protein